MGSALYIVAEKDLSDFDMVVDGKALARAEKDLSAVCARIGVKSLMNFFSQNPDDLADMLGEDVPDLPPEKWFEAQDGLVTIRALLSRLDAGTESINSAPAVANDLRACERVLAHLEEKKTRWHFAIDI
jgi:hypothetical protein